MSGKKLSFIDREKGELCLELLSRILPENSQREGRITPGMIWRGLGRLEKEMGLKKLGRAMEDAICERNQYDDFIEELFNFAASKGTAFSDKFFLRIIGNKGNHLASQLGLQAFAECGSRALVLETLIKTLAKDDFILHIIAAKCLSKFKDDAAADALGKVLAHGDLSRLDVMLQGEQALSVEYASAESLAGMGTNNAILWLCALHIRAPDCAMLKKPILEMPETVLPILIDAIPGIQCDTSRKTVASLMVELGGGQSAIDSLTKKIRLPGNEHERAGITSAIISIRKAEAASLQARQIPQGGILPEKLELKRFPTNNPRAGRGTGAPQRQGRVQP